MESLMIKQKSNVWSHSSSGVQTSHFTLQSRLAAVFQSWEINLPSEDSEKLCTSTLWVITAWKAVICSYWSSARTPFLFGVNRSRWIPERPDSPIWASADKTPAPLSLWEAAKRPLLSPTLAAFHPAISYLFILGFMNLQACKSEHMDVADRKVKTQPLSIFYAFTQVVHIDSLLRFPTSYYYCCWAPVAAMHLTLRRSVILLNTPHNNINTMPRLQNPYITTLKRCITLIATPEHLKSISSHLYLLIGNEDHRYCQAQEIKHDFKRLINKTTNALSPFRSNTPTQIIY